MLLEQFLYFGSATDLVDLPLPGRLPCQTAALVPIHCGSVSQSTGHGLLSISEVQFLHYHCFEEFRH